MLKRNLFHQSLIAELLLFAILIIAAPIAKAQNEGHPLIRGFEGSVITGQEVKEFDEQTLVIGKVQYDGSVKTVKLEGKITKIDYSDPENRSSLERIRNYEQAFKKAGFEIKFMCGKEECGHEIGIETIGYYPPERYLTAFQKRKEGNVWIGVFVAAGPWTKIIIAEEKPMETGMVMVSADFLKTNILKDGHVAVYGIYFDTGKSEIKAESEPSLEEIAKMLKQNATIKLFVVGHTDNVGGVGANMTLSKARAESVVKELTTKHGVGAGQLAAYGVGSLSPVGPNATEEGRALNRRVELVAQ